MMVRKNIPFELKADSKQQSPMEISTAARFGWGLSKEKVGGAPANHELPNQACADTNK